MFRLIYLNVAFLIVILAVLGNKREGFCEPGSKVYFCVQIGSFSKKELALEFFNKVKHLPEARIEKIGWFYTVRVGLKEKRKDIILLYKELKKEFKDAWLRTCYYIPSRIIMPVKRIQKITEAKPIKKHKQKVTTERPSLEVKKKQSVKIKIPEQKHLVRRIRPSSKTPLGVIPRNKLIIFPVENISGVSNIPERKIINYWAHFFKKQNYQILFPKDIEEFLFAKRIRRFHYLSTSLAQELRQKFAAEAVVLSWVDLYNLLPPELGIGIKIIDTQTGNILWINYITLRGDDFRSWFGLGEIKDMEKLMRVAVKRLLRKFPATLTAQKRKIPIEKLSTPILDMFSLVPKEVRGGDTVNISLRLIASKGMCRRVAVLIGGKEIFLEKASSVWKGSTNAPKEEGFYFTKLKIWDKKGLIHFINTGMILTVDNTPPKLKVSYENPVFSPNNDGVKESVIFSLIEFIDIVCFIQYTKKPVVNSTFISR